MSWPTVLPRPLVLGHRGASARETENTMESFDLAMSEGAHGIELDTRLSRDGVPVVFHDDDLRRLADRPERIDSLSAAELARVQLRGDRRIPTLAEVLADIPGWINVEIKPPPAARIRAWGDAVNEVIDDSGARERILVTSFHPGVLLWLRARRARLALGVLFHARQNVLLRAGGAAAAIFPRAVHPEHVLVTPQRVRQWRRLGLAIGAWTVDDPARARELASMGVTAIITNDPAGILSAVDG